MILMSRVKLMNSILEKEIWSLRLIVNLLKDFVEFFLAKFLIVFLRIGHLKNDPMEALLIWVFNLDVP